MTIRSLTLATIPVRDAGPPRDPLPEPTYRRPSGWELREAFQLRCIRVAAEPAYRFPSGWWKVFLDGVMYDGPTEEAARAAARAGRR